MEFGFILGWILDYLKTLQAFGYVYAGYPQRLLLKYALRYLSFKTVAARNMVFLEPDVSTF